ncbi:MAG: glycosyltransferase family 39 protein [Anaerolineae bacterium]|nr:glycosyltransferase family 39 protein [Anaerolineae bacterium]
MQRSNRRPSSGRFEGLLQSLGRLTVPLVLAAMLLPVFGILLQGDALPCTHDNVFHSFRIVAMREMLRHGWLFSRWVPNLALGYGYPFFTYREPLPYLVGEVLFALGVPLPLVLGGLYAASLLAGAWGAYVLARDLFGPRAAFVSAVAYGLAPYVLMDALRRGNMPESVGLALLPWLFVVMRRLILHKGRGRFVAAVGLLVALFLSHNISSLLLAPFLGLYVVVLAVAHRDRGGWPYAFAAVAIAVLLTAWFWLPALTEQDFVQLHLSRSTRNNDFRYNFASWREMVLTLPKPYDPAYVNPPMRISLGIGQAVLALVGGVLGLARARKRETRWLVALFLVFGTAYLWMATPGSLGVWERLPLLSFVQFPWRFVGRALLPVSLLAGLAVETAFGSADRGWPQRRHLGAAGEGRVTYDRSGGLQPGSAGVDQWRRWLPPAATVACVAGLFLLSWPETYPPKGICEVGRYPDLAALYALEQAGWMGMDPESSYFPIWVEEHPQDTALAEAFMGGELPARFDTSVLPQGGEIVDAVYRPLSASLTVRTPEPFQARWLGFYYPGWRVTVDGEHAVATSEDNTGLLRFEIPAGEHTVRVRFGLTPVRALGTGLAVLGALATVGVFCIPALRPLYGDARGAPADLGPGSPGLTWAILGLSLGALILRYGLLGQIPTPWVRSRLAGGALPEVSVHANRLYESGLRLLGYTVGSEQLPGDGELAVSLLWQAERRPSHDVRMSVLLRGQDGQIWSSAGTVRPRGYEQPPSSRSWQAGVYVYDPHIVIPDAGTPPGVYEIVVAVFDEDTLAPSAPLDGEGRPLGTDLVIGSIELLPPSRPADLEAFGLQPLVAPAECGPLRLLAFSLDREAGLPGDVVAARWVWAAEAAPETDVEVVLSLVGPGGEEVRQWSLPPVAEWWPTSRWQAGERWAGEQVVRLPGDLESGLYALRVQVATCEKVLGTATIDVVAPARVWSVPDGLVADSVTFGGQLALAGHAIVPEQPGAGDELELTLAWEAIAPMATSYRIFLHLVAQDGTLVDQDDGEPAGWSRPTTGWAVGEVIVERRGVVIPADGQGAPYALRAGVYAPDGGRLAIDGDGADNYVIETVLTD